MRRFVTPSILVATILAAPGAALAKGAMCGDQSRCRFRVPEFQPLNYRLAIFWAVDSGYVFTSERGGPFTTTAASPVTSNDVTDVAVDRLFHLALNALSNNAVDRRWRDIRIGSYLAGGNVIGGRHSVRGGSTFCFVGEVKKGGRRSYSASRRSTNDERNQYQGPHSVTPLARRFNPMSIAI